MIYIIYGDEILELTVTTDISINLETTTSKHKMEDGTVVSDNVVNQNKSFSISGMVSEIESYLIINRESDEIGTDVSGFIKPFQKSVTDYYFLLQRIRDSKELVTFLFDYRIDQGGLPDCIITSVTFTRDASLGEAYQVNLKVDQLRRSERARTSERRELRSPNLTSDEVDGSTKPTTEQPVDTLFKGIKDTIFGGFSG